MVKRTQDTESSFSRKRVKDVGPAQTTAGGKNALKTSISADATELAKHQTCAESAAPSMSTVESPASEPGTSTSSKSTIASEVGRSPSSHGPSTPKHWPASTRASPTTGNPNAPGHGLRGSFHGIDYVPEPVLHRLVAFTTKVDTKKHRYLLATIPSNTNWGTTSRTDKFLCIDNEPITVWALANLESTWFTDPNGNLHGRVNVGFQLPYRGDNDFADKLYLKANPPITDKDDVKFSGRYMKRYGKNSSTATIVPFEAVYDATQRFRPKSEMAMIAPCNIRKRDIVLVESNFTRWKEGDAKKIRKWTEWKAGLDLQAVSLLFEAPEDLVLEPGVPTVDDEDDDL